MLKGMVFDMDGTITVLTLPLEDMRQDTKDYFIERGLPPDILEPADGISSSTNKAREYFLNNGLDIDEWNQWESEVDDILSLHEGSVADTAVAIDGALEVVSQIRDLGLLTAILTNNGRPAVDRIVGQISLEAYFDLIQTRHESPKPKPFPDGLLKVVDKLGLTPSEVIYVGDAMIDAVASRRAGIEFWGVCTGETEAAILKGSGASRVFHSLEEIYESLNERLTS